MEVNDSNRVYFKLVFTLDKFLASMLSGSCEDEISAQIKSTSITVNNYIDSDDWNRSDKYKFGAVFSIMRIIPAFYEGDEEAI